MKVNHVSNYFNESLLVNKMKSDLEHMYLKYDDIIARLIEMETKKHLDRVTQLPNIEHFNQMINKRLKKHEYGTIFIFDICDFGRVNVEFGYEIGDKVLSAMGSAIKSEADGDVYTGYFGCNRFGIYKKDSLNYDDAYSFFSQVKQRVLNVLRGHFELNLRAVATPINKDFSKLNDIYIKSEVMLKRLKSRRSEFLYFDKTQQQVENSKDELAKYVKESVSLGNYYVVYQEKVDSMTNKVVGLEALARLKRNDRIISPNVFIPILEGSNNIVGFGNVIIESVLKNMDFIEEKYGNDIVVSINISPKQFGSAKLKDWLGEVAEKYSVDLSKIEFEITENVFVNDIDHCINQLLDLKEKGVRFALDDFGTGYSSLQYLTKLPVNTLKIDKSFIDQIYHEQTKLVVKAIIDVGKASNLNIVAEGVEDKRQVEILNSIGCNIIQGYYYSKPKLLK